MGTPALEIKELHAWYGESHILHNLNLTVQTGEVVTLLGRNGDTAKIRPRRQISSTSATTDSGTANGMILTVATICPASTAE